jgi:hypothetical protein
MWSDEPRPVRLDVCKGDGQTNYKRQLAYERLGISPSDVQIIPFFADQLKRIARRVNWGAQQASSQSPAQPLEYLRSSEDPDAYKVFTAYLSVPKSYRRLLPPEAFCRAADVSPQRVLECITVAAMQLGIRGSSIVAAILQPRVVEKLAERALTDNAAATILLKATGFLPSRH